MLANLSSDIRPPMRGPGGAFVREFAERVAIDNPAVPAAERRGRRALGLARKLHAVTFDEGGARIPRGLAREFRAFARHRGVELTYDDARAWVAAGVAFAVPMLRDHQERAVAAMLCRHQGLVVLPAGGGKTRTALAFIARSGARTLIMVFALDLARQWVGELRTVLGIEPGMIGGGECRDDGPVVVAMAQTLASWEPERRAGFLAGFGALIVDEAHHSVAESWREVIEACPARYRFGLTATPERPDGLGPILGWTFGEVIVRVPHSDLIDAGHLVEPERVELVTAFEFAYSGPDDWARLLEALWQDAERNALIAAFVLRLVADGHCVILLTAFVKHCELLASALREQGIAAEALTGKTKKADRARILEGARTGAVSALVATSLADEGLDLPRLSAAVLAFPAKAAGRVEQRIGRIMRPHPGKPSAVVVDVVDKRVGVLAGQAKKRAATFARIAGGGQ